MNKINLEKELNNSKVKYEYAINQKEILENNDLIIAYLNHLKTIELEQEYQKFLNKLEVGTDGTVFSPYEDYIEKPHRITHFGLSRVLTHLSNLINLKVLNEELIYTNITIEQLSEYIDNASSILTEMKYYPEDRKYKNIYNLDIYLNPKNYSIIESKEIYNLTSEKLCQSYNIPSNLIINDDGICVIFDSCLSIEKIEKITPREEEAFYGEEAQKILGILPEKVKVKNKRK